MPFNFPLAPPAASNFAGEYDAIFYALLALTILFTLIVLVGVVLFTVRYRRGTKFDRSRPIYEDLRLELSWTITPLILGVIVFFFGANLFVKMRTPPKDAQEIFVIGKQWMWHVQHADSGVRENNTLHVPVGKPVKLTMISQDVIHAFYIPAFRVQMHVVPGRYTSMWFTATKAGEYHLFCNMYCGTQHSEMGGKVVAMEPAKYAEWVANGGNGQPALTMEQAGARTFARLGCNNCHGAESNLRGPTLVNIAGTTRPTSGGNVKADDAYLRESILTPWQKLTKGYGQTMPTYAGQLSEEDVLNLIAYVKSGGVSSGGIRTDEAINPAKGSDPTPTTRQGAPAVGAIGYQQQNP